MSTPIAPPSQIHQGSELGEALNFGGNPPPMVTVSTKSIAVPLAKEINDACRGCATLLPKEPFTLGWAPRHAPAPRPMSIEVIRKTVDAFTGWHRYFRRTHLL